MQNPPHPTTARRSHATSSGTIRLLAALLGCLAFFSQSQAEVLNIVGSAGVNLPVAEAAQTLRSEKGLEIHINTTGGSNAGIGAVGDGIAQIGMATRKLTPEDRADSPEVNFKQIYLGAQVAGLVVSRDVWEGGVHALKRAQARAIYERKITNWKMLGGPDQTIVFFNPDEGRGVWELFIQWIYGDSKRVGLGHFPTVGSNEEARNSVEFTRGSMTVLSPRFADGKELFVLALEGENNKAFFPSIENITSEKYPLAKPMFFILNDKPTLNVKVIVDYMLGEQGQRLLKKCGYYSVKELEDLDIFFKPPE